MYRKLFGVVCSMCVGLQRVRVMCDMLCSVICGCVMGVVCGVLADNMWWVACHFVFVVR